jgi:hypothetical protein
MKGLRVAILFILLCILLSITSIFSEELIDNEFKDEKPKKNSTPLWAGYVGCLVASVFFGSNLLPVKQFSAGDGFFFQFIYCVAVWVVGQILDLILNNQRFYPLVILGGIK